MWEWTREKVKEMENEKEERKEAEEERKRSKKEERRMGCNSQRKGRGWKRRSVGRKRYSRDSSSAKSGVYEDESPSGVFGFVRCLPSTAPFSSIIANSSSKSAIVRFIAIRTRRRSTVRCVQCLVPPLVKRSPSSR